MQRPSDNEQRSRSLLRQVAAAARQGQQCFQPGHAARRRVSLEACNGQAVAPQRRLPGDGAGTGSAQRGQSTVEFSLVVPVLLVLALAAWGFGLLYQNKIALDNAVRDAVRYASQHPTVGGSMPSPAANTIQGRLVNAGGISTTPTITIQYGTVTTSTSGSSTTASSAYCGTYSSSAPTGCTSAGHLVTVTALVNYQIPVPFVSNVVRALFKNGVPLQSSASMLIEQCPTTDSGC